MATQWKIKREIKEEEHREGFIINPNIRLIEKSFGMAKGASKVERDHKDRIERWKDTS